jgi:hypothetical protein
VLQLTSIAGSVSGGTISALRTDEVLTAYTSYEHSYRYQRLQCEYDQCYAVPTESLLLIH